MDVATFVKELLSATAAAGCFEGVSLQAEGPVVKGRGYVAGGGFVRVYFNERTGTIAFALIRDERRVWGIDHDHQRQWHRHPLADPQSHQVVPVMTIAEIVDELVHVLAEPGNELS